jgi:hypothetical protein
LADGNVGCGKSITVKLPVSALGAAAPTESQATWSFVHTGQYPAFTSKAARPLANGNVAVLLYLGSQPWFAGQASVVMLNSAGVKQWETNHGVKHGEGTEMAVSHDQLHLVIGGQGPGPAGVWGAAGDGPIVGTASTEYVRNTLSGRITSIKVSDGSYEWSKSYSSIDYSAGDPSKLIKNECWGIAAIADGYIMGCGTGIETCDGVEGQLKTDCDAGNADKRAGAYTRQGGTWQSLIIRTDLAGTLQWQRVDQYRHPETPAIGQTGSLKVSSACEFILVDPGGATFTAIQDEQSGVGLLRLNADSVPGRSTTATATASPPPAAVASAASPPPAPLTPPVSAEVAAKRTVVVTLTVAGEVTDYADGSAKANSIKQKLATLAKVAANAVTLAVTAASVNIKASIYTASEDAAAVVKTAVATQMKNATAASSFLGVTVTAAPVVATQAEVAAPCFPSTATVRLVDGTPKQMDALQEGDEIIAATSDGILTSGTVSLFSLAKPEAEATFITLSMSKEFKLTITPEHHLPVGAECCSTLKMAKDVVVGDKVWAVGTTPGMSAHTVTAKGAVIKNGLHSPVLTNGAMPVVDGVVTSFDNIAGVNLATYTLGYAIPICKATFTCSILRRAASSVACAYESVFGSGGACKQLKYIDGLELGAQEVSPSTLGVSSSMEVLGTTMSCAK